MANNDRETVKEMAHYYIDLGVNATFVWTCFLFIAVQYFYMAALKKISSCQKFMEEAFMGPEIAAAPIIQYIAVPAGQYPSYANPG
jgi:hypothetical protein